MLLSPLSSLLLISLDHLSNHLVIFPRPDSVPTFTVATILSHRVLNAKQVSSRNDECSEYGTPYNMCLDVELRMGVRDEGRKLLDCMRVMRGASAGRVSVPAGGEYLVISKNVHQIEEMEQGSQVQELTYTL